MRDAGDLTNVFSGAADLVVQAGSVHGGVHIHRSPGQVLPVRQLPFDVPDFTGRVEELQRLDALLTPGETVVISAIAGQPGVGKTATAVHWAHRVSKRFPDGQLFVDLRGFDVRPPMPAQHALDAFLRALGVAPERIPPRLDEAAALFRSVLADRRMLVVLDNARDADQVRPLLPGSATCAVVITSRNSLAGLVAGAGVHRVTLDVLSTAEAAALLTATVGPDRMRSEPQAARKLAELCAHLPLAMRIAAERIAHRPNRTISGLVGQLAVADQGRLDVLAVPGDKHGAVRLAFSLSYQALPRSAASMFRRLSWHPGHEFEIPAAAALAGIPRHEAADALVVLWDTHLITEIGHERYRFHDLMRLYAEERARAEETDAHRADGVSRLLRYYLHRADAADHLLTRRSSCVPFNHKQTDTDPTVFTDQRQAANWCERERTNLMAAIHQAAEHGEHTVAWQLPVALWGFFFLRKYWQDWVSALNIGLTSARTIGDRRGEAWVLHSLREAHFSMHRPEDTTDNVRQTLAIFRDIDDQLGIREALSNLGYAHRLHGRPDEALNELGKALTLWRQADDPWGQGWTLHSLGETYLDLGRWEHAARALHESRQLFGSIEHRQAEGFALSNLGYVQLGTKQYATAIEYFQQAMAIHEEVRDQWSAARTLKGLGIAHYHTAKTRLATQYWRRALTICEELNDQPAATKIRALMESPHPTEHQPRTTPTGPRLGTP